MASQGTLIAKIIGFISAASLCLLAGALVWSRWRSGESVHRQRAGQKSSVGSPIMADARTKSVPFATSPRGIPFRIKARFAGNGNDGRRLPPAGGIHAGGGDLRGLKSGIEAGGQARRGGGGRGP